MYSYTYIAHARNVNNVSTPFYASPETALVTAFSANNLTVSLSDMPVTVTFVGKFTYEGTPELYSQVTGTIFSKDVYNNSAPRFSETWAEGTDVVLDASDFAYELSKLSGNDYFEGSSTTAFNDTVQGLGGNDRFKGFGSTDSATPIVSSRENSMDRFFGGDGVDTSVYQGKISEYSIISSKGTDQSPHIWDMRVNTANTPIEDGVRTPGFYVRDNVSNRDDWDTLAEIERLEFETPEANGANRIALDIDGNAGQAYRLYKAAFNRSPDTAGLGYWIANLDEGMSLRIVSTAFIGSAEFQALYGVDTSNNKLIELLYNNVLSRDPDADGLNYWQGQLTAGLSHSDLLVNFSESNENQENVIALIGNGIAYEQWLG